MVKRHLENLSGRIYFESNENEGSTFTAGMLLKKVAVGSCSRQEKGYEFMSL